jgi:hypothetical protein
MNRRFLLAFLAVLLLNNPKAVSGADFRGFDWGAAMDDVRAGERAKFHEAGDDYLAYWTTFAGYDVLLMYYFDPAFGLTGADYGLADVYDDPDKYVDAFKGLRDALKAEFGEGDLIVKWADRSLEHEYEGKLGLALADGQVTLERSWVTDRTSVYLKARNDGENVEDILVTVHYYSAEYLEKKKSEEPTGPTIHKKTPKF